MKDAGYGSGSGSPGITPLGGGRRDLKMARYDSAEFRTRIGRSVLGSAAGVMVLVLLPTAGFAYDLAGLLGGPNDWLYYGFPLYSASKFGADLTWYGFVAEGGAWLLRHVLPLSGVASIHVAWKAWLVLATLVSGLCFRYLERQRGSRRGFGFLWVTSPAVLWVAVGHGQIEPIAVMCTLGALILLERRSNWSAILAGGLIAFGAGFEIFPLAVLVGLLFLLLAREVRPRRVLWILGSTVAMLVVCYAPLFLVASRRNQLFEALAASSSSGPARLAGPSTGLSIWNVTGLLGSPSRAVLLGVAVCYVAFVFGITALAHFRKGINAYGGSHVVVGLLLIGAVLLDPVSSPQFAVIAAAGVWLVSIELGSSVFLVWMVPVLGVMTYLVIQSPWWFFYDIWGQVPTKLWSIPSSNLVAVILARSFTVLGVGFVIWFLWRLVAAAVDCSARTGGRSAERFNREWIAVSSVGLVLLMSGTALGVTPSLWKSVWIGGPSNLIDLNGALGWANGISVSNTSVRLVVPKSLRSEVEQAKIKPTGFLSVVPRSLTRGGYPGAIAEAMSTRDVSSLRIGLPHLVRGVHVTSYAVYLLLGSGKWSSEKSLSSSRPVVQFGNERVEPRSAYWSSTGWAVFGFQVPARLSSGGNGLDIRAVRGVEYWDGWRTSAVDPVSRLRWRPAISVFYGSGSFVPRCCHVKILTFDSQFGAVGPASVVSGLPWSHSSSIRFTSLPFSISRVTGGGLKFLRRRSLNVALLFGCGIVWVVGLGVGAGALGRSYRRPWTARVGEDIGRT